MMPLILHLPEVKKEAKIALEHVHDIGYVHGIVKTAISVNTGELKGAALEKALAQRLRELLGGVAWLKDWQIEIVPMDDRRGSDINATLPLPNGGMAELWVVCKSNPRPHQIAYDRTQDFPSPQSKRQKRVWVLAAPFVSSRMSQLCQELRWSWFDLAGNCHLSVPDAFQIERTGQPPVHRLPKSGANLSTPEAVRILRALLATDNAGRKWTQRDLQLHARPNVSIGLVNKVVRHLHDEAFIENLPDGGFKLRAPVELLKAWRDAYRFDRHQRRSYFTLLQGRRLQEALAKLEALTGGHAAYAAFSAADFQAPHVRQPKTWLYVAADWEDKFREVAEAKLVDSGENLVVLIPEDDGVFYLGDGGTMEEQRLSCTNPVQTYVDLFHCGGRGEEAAEALLEQNLKRAWKARGLL
ncbi:MAG TPA: type IV toxin-antitoxin system AbiEi family antitoxin [Candidatus Saccharimonadales bacterium]|nr:type IV toxin-antitoxin system AbiEi family antitoxin [Candidatus Saccharimonadales bacterium]